MKSAVTSPKNKKKTLMICFLILVVIFLSSDCLNLLSPMKSFPSTSSAYIEDWNKTWNNLGGKAIAVDSSGNIYVTGNNTERNGDIFLLKYDSAGNLLWETDVAGPEIEGVCDLVVDSSGNVFIAGYTNSWGSGGYDVYFEKFDSSGNMMWAHSLGDQHDQYAIGIDIDNSGNVYVVDNNGYMIKCDSFGNWGGEYIYLGYSFQEFALDDSGNITVAGQIYKGEQNNVLLEKYDLSGNLLWNNTWWRTNTPYVYPRGIAIDSTGNAYVMGYITSSWSDVNVFLLKFDPSGNPIWDTLWVNLNTDYGYGISLDSMGNIYITGSTNNRAVLLKYNPSGTLIFNQTWSTFNRGEGIALDTLGNVYITGGGLTVLKLLLDTDGDGLSDYEETSTYTTDPNKSDTDGDGLSDGDEVNVYETDPISSDTDGDGYSDGQEIQTGTDPLSEFSNLTLIIIIPIIVVFVIIISTILIIKRNSIKKWSRERKETKKLEREKAIAEREEVERKEREERDRYDKEKLEKKIEFENRFPIIEQMIQEKKFSEVTKELENIIEKAKYFNLISILDWARDKKKLVDRKKEVKILAFISYSLKDSDLFKVRDLAEKLTSYEEIENVLYCEEDTKDNFIKYMNKYVGECDLMILFCSPNALLSKFVEDEWMAAHAMDKPIIPVFLKTEHIPPLLKARVGVEFDSFNLQKTINELYNLILKKTQTE